MPLPGGATASADAPLTSSPSSALASVIPQNQARFTLDELCRITGGQLAIAGRAESVAGVATDTRVPLAGRAFVALRGARFDAHDYLHEAAQAEAAALIAERAPVGWPPGPAAVLVPDTLSALGQLGRAHRDRWAGPVAAVGGSVGKTTTRTVLAALLAGAAARVHCPAGNLNNLIGVPMVLLGLSSRAQVAVVELGTNATGEVAQLARLARPQLGLLTRVALEHCEGLGGLDEIEREEGQLLRGLPESGTAVTNADDPRCLRQLLASPARLWVTYGTSAPPALGVPAGVRHRHYRLVRGESTESGAQLALSRVGDFEASVQGSAASCRSPLLGLPGALAVAAALGATEALLQRPLSDAELQRGLDTQRLGEPGRLTPVPLPGGVLVLDDTYNASPEAVLSSASVAQELRAQRGGRLLLVLGEMGELGARSAQLHRETGSQLAQFEPEQVIGFAGDARLMVEQYLKTRPGGSADFAPDALAALALVRARLQPGDTVLVKGSRGLRGERVVQGLAGGLGDSA